MASKEVLDIENKNLLFPVFLKLEGREVLIIGGGQVALEKINTLLDNNPNTSIKVVSKDIIPEITELSNAYPNLKIIKKAYEPADLEGIDLVITATDDLSVTAGVREDARKKGIWMNSADKPELCDFYLGSVVQKGHLKIAISTNGKSPIMAKRIKESLSYAFPGEIHEVLENLYEIRKNLKVDYHQKVKTLRNITKSFSEQQKKHTLLRQIRRTSLYSLCILLIMVLGHLLFSALTFQEIWTAISGTLSTEILIYMGGGFMAQMIDGALGMAYGVSVTTFLLGLGIPSITPAIASASMHASEIFTTGTSSLVYMRYKNINKKLFKSLVIPGILGAMGGALFISILSKKYVTYVRPLVAVYTLTLGIIIIKRAMGSSIHIKNKIKKIFPIAFFGGFLDSVGGGGWGPIVTTSLIAGGRDLRNTIGSSHLAKFFVALVSTITFVGIIGLSHWKIIFGLIVGGMLAAPISIYLSQKIPTKKGLILVGSLVILISLKIFVQSLFK
ncbi:MAG: TSUP family transporter [Bacteroidia bacterium]|nr:TSUP family transporter [Bacteroidia bacterium]